MKNLPKRFDPNKCQAGTAEIYDHVVVKAFKCPLLHERIRLQQIEFGMSEEEAKGYADEYKVELEILFDPTMGGGVFAIESDSIDDCVNLRSPFSGEVVENLEDLQ